MEANIDELKIAAAILLDKTDKSKEEIVEAYWELYDMLRERLKMPGVGE